ncbi:MAG: flagellar biosynthesis protein FlhF [Desulfovibrionales bacterium]|nr:flagellar biosynthesis protein FlhF [Desulfovibrionales bacterium]
MQVKTFSGITTREVLAQIKREMGTEAVILSKQEGKNAHTTWCEITAGVEPAPEPVVEEAPVMEEDACTAPKGWNDWHNEWSEIKDHLTELMKPNLQLHKLSPRQRLALEHLQRHDVEDTVLMRLMRPLRQDASMSILSPLGKQIDFKPWGTEWRGRVHTFVGPFGVGKTSTAVRMALELRAQNHSTRICFINADSARGNGRLLLRHYAQLCDMGYFEVRDAVSFARTIRDAANNYDKILIDMPGLGLRESFTEQIEKFGLHAIKENTLHRVLSPSANSKQLSAILEKYSAIEGGSIVWTKLDEACTFGTIINTAVSTGLPVSAFSYGAGLKGTLVPAKDVMLWRLLFKNQLPGEYTIHQNA